MGLFTWSIESIPNRVARQGKSTEDPHEADGKFGAGARAQTNQMDKHQMAAERSFQKQKAYFSDPKRVPYPLQGDVMRMGNQSDKTKKAEKERLQGFAEEHKKHMHPEAAESEEPDGFTSSEKKRRRADENTPSFYR